MGEVAAVADVAGLHPADAEEPTGATAVSTKASRGVTFNNTPRGGAKLVEPDTRDVFIARLERNVGESDTRDGSVTGGAGLNTGGAVESGAPCKGEKYKLAIDLDNADTGANEEVVGKCKIEGTASVEVDFNNVLPPTSGMIEWATAGAESSEARAERRLAPTPARVIGGTLAAIMVLENKAAKK